MGQETVGIDTSLFIYFFEEHPDFVDQVEQILQSIKKGERRAVFSSVGMIELLTGPKKRNRPDIARHYQDILSSFPNLVITGMNESIVEYASDLRARYGLTTPDAIHVATALDAGAAAFYTNDRSLKKVKEITIRFLKK